MWCLVAVFLVSAFTVCTAPSIFMPASDKPGRFTLRPNIEFHLCVSRPPCGDLAVQMAFPSTTATARAGSLRFKVTKFKLSLSFIQ